MPSIRDLLPNTITAKVTVTAAAIVIVGGGAALAAPGIVGSASDDDAPPAETIETVDESLERIGAFCEDDNPDAPFCSGPSEGYDPDDDHEDNGGDSEDDGLEDPEEGEGATAFSEWVRSLPNDWGCVRGQLVSHAARMGPHSGAHEELNFESAAEAAEFLELEGRCVEVAIARSGDEGDPVDVKSADGPGRGNGGPPAHAGKPEHAGKPGDVGQKGNGNGKGNNGRGHGANR